MFKTAEVRWFSAGKIPRSVKKWFREAASEAVVEPVRTDYYLNLTGSLNLGIKYRQGWLEVKLREKALGIVRFTELVSGELESWVKWGLFIGTGVPETPGLNSEIWVPVIKERQMVSYNLVDEEWLIQGGKLEPMRQGCEIELTEVVIGSSHWWTFALEASGSSGRNKMLLMDVAGQFFSSEISPEMKDKQSYSYPWLICQNS